MSLLQDIKEVGELKGINREVLIDALKAAILTAARRVYGIDREFEADFNEETGDVELFQIVTVVDELIDVDREILITDLQKMGSDAQLDEELAFQVFYHEKDREKAKKQDEIYGDVLGMDSYNSTFGRIAAQTAKQVIIQRIREAERDLVHSEFVDRVGEMITGMVRRFEKGDIIIDLGKTDAILPRREQTPRESYRQGERIQAMIKDVRKSSRDPQVVLTRSDPRLLFKLFGQEVPEIEEGTVRIVAVSREPGVRCKVAVYSRDSAIDPVGACVGIRGARVQAVVSELRGEKIDIVQYVDQPAPFVGNAILPAEVSKVLIDDANMTMELIVPDDQLSLAIGRGGQNVRLAAQLTGWNLDIISETRLRNMMNEAKNNLLEFSGIDDEMIDTLFSLGYNKLEHIAQADVSELVQVPGYNEEKAKAIIGASVEILKRPTQKSLGDMSPEELEKRELQTIRGVGGKVAAAIHKAGYHSVKSVAFAEDPEAMAAAAGIPMKKGKQLIHAAKTQVSRERKWDDEAFEKGRILFYAAIAEKEAAALAEKEAAAIAAGQAALEEDEDDAPVEGVTILSRPGQEEE